MTTLPPNTRRFFVSPDVFQSETVTLCDAAMIHQMQRVLRLRAGDHILLLDGLGHAFVVRVMAITRQTITGIVVERILCDDTPTLSITLALPLLRAERFEWVLQKGTELGVAAFIPMTMQHSVATLPSTREHDQKYIRWRRIIQEASEQACRTRLPTIEPLHTFEEVCRRCSTADMTLLLWEGNEHEQAPLLRSLLRQHPHPQHSWLFLSGPEGGISPQELTIAREHGIIPVSLGHRILRADTAPIVAVASLFYEYMD